MITSAAADGTDVRAFNEGSGPVILIIHPGFDDGRSRAKMPARLRGRPGSCASYGASTAWISRPCVPTRSTGRSKPSRRWRWQSASRWGWPTASSAQ